ncbi:3-dehydroquinate synthase [Sediminibacterium soli]|uniref:3-dehydroquinate synthase n=1 Tax=Sediminibacterium soli TaxID=2698829 RepID=UPI00137B49A3|nr:3-dehydroquinate synthase [Sediminibacterium soli]NCI45932.1 3-dehydroquinate synthase [Sediminibacterium soli]
MKKQFQFSTAKVDYYFDTGFSYLEKLVSKDQAVILTDTHVFAAHKKLFKNWRTIVIEAGEQHKNQATADSVIEQLIAWEADRKTTLIGVGGGVVTDMAGYVAGIYMRGIPCGFVPTSLLAMVDASIGGKNGIDVGVYKNMVGLIRQPRFLLFDTGLLRTLPLAEWQNGFAEIIKHACIRDAAMFRLLESHKVSDFRKDTKLLNAIVKRNVLIKTKVVANDEFEQGERKLLNFGHTLGHAIENMYQLSHGQAISVGMTYAAVLSQQLTGFKQAPEVTALLGRYGLPTQYDFDRAKAFAILKQDKKKNRDSIHYILLEKIGKGTMQLLPFTGLETLLAKDKTDGK